MRALRGGKGEKHSAVRVGAEAGLCNIQTHIRSNKEITFFFLFASVTQRLCHSKLPIYRYYIILSSHMGYHFTSLYNHYIAFLV